MSGFSGNRKLYKAIRQNYYMVVKFICEVTEGVGDSFKPARVIYTGTGKRYLNQTLDLFGEFSQFDKEVYLDESIFNACGYAKQRASFYGDVPTLLIVDSRKLKGEIYYDGRYRTKTLPLGSFLPHEIKLDARGKLCEEDYYRITQIQDIITEASEEDIRNEVAKFLSARS